MKVSRLKSPTPWRSHCLLWLCALLLSSWPAAATIDASMQLLLGNPSNATADPNNHSHYLIQRTVEAIDYNDTLGVANWASWDLTWSDFNPSVGRSGTYTADTNLPPGFYQVTSSDYSNSSNYDRGHMCPSADRTDTEADNQLVFFLSNFIPQAADNNQGVWESFETYCRALAATNEVLITCGPSGFSGAWVPSGKVAIPQYVWKVVVVVPTNNSVNVLDRINTSTRVIAIKTPNTNGLSRSIAWQTFVTSVNQIQSDTGYTFFTALPTNIASVLRAKIDGQAIPVPGITGFSPSSGAAGTAVVITGTNLDSTTAVSFHGTSATFTVNSSSQVTATVPAGAGSGTLSLTTAGGTATSASSFTVTTAAVPDLALALSHTGTFAQGDTADVYTLVVTNVGAAASTGTVTVTDTLPPGLTATAIGGNGWTVSLNPPTCTRSDGLVAGASYPPITLTVSVSPTAAVNVTNTATVSGGGDSFPANNTATDPTLILTAGPPVVTTGLATAVATTTASLNGTVNPNNQPETAWFEYGLTASYGATGAISGTLSGNTAQPVSFGLSGLSSGTTYHFRLNASNILGVTSGADQSFATGSGTGTSSGTTTLAGWDVSTMTGGSGNFGPALLPPTTNAANLMVGNLTRGSGIATNASGAGRAWGGAGFTNTSAAAAVAANQFVTFSATASAGYTVSYTAVSQLSTRHSSTGPANGLLQCQVGAGGFTDITNLTYASQTNVASPIDLTGVAALQNVGPGVPVTFRLVNWGGGSSGTWYIFDVSNSPAADLALQGTISPAVVATPDLAVMLSHSAPFTQGDVGDTCTIIVTNLGSAATSGFVSVSNALPAGLSATAISGSGWTPNLATLTCTRSDALAPGGTYPPITVTVDVATNAPNLLTNLVTVLGGGDATPANNSASDVLSILSLTPLQSWRGEWFGTTANSGSAADGAVLTSDGLPNLVKYALGLDPLVPATNPVVGDITTGFLRLTSPKNPNATDVIFTVEASSNVLTGWSTNGTVVDLDTATQLKVHDSTPVNAAPERFLRLRISRP